MGQTEKKVKYINSIRWQIWVAEKRIVNAGDRSIIRLNGMVKKGLKEKDI